MKPYTVQRCGPYWRVGNAFQPGTETLWGKCWDFDEDKTAYAVMAVLNELLATENERNYAVSGGR